MLKNIVINPDTQEIKVDSKALVAEAEARTHAKGHPTYMDQFLAGKTKLRKRHGWWPEDKRIEVASLFAAGVVSSSDLERLTKVPATAIRTWRTQDWWPELLERIHASIDEETVSKFTKIVDKSLDVIQDRLINGDFVLDKRTGQAHRKEVSMRDAAVVAATVVDKRQLLRGKPTSRTEKISVDARLSKLADEFKRFTESQEISGEAKVINSET